MDGKSSHYNAELLVDHDQKASTSHFGANVNAPAIFLSHSGRQKHFVEHLFNALVNANHTEHTVFFDKHSLPKGSPFPDHIREAALSCKLGVVILSHEFFTSKWPMLELEMLVLHKGPDPKVFPVCYELNFEDLKSSANLSRWRSEWVKMEGGKHVDQWAKAVQDLARFNGEIYERGKSEIACIKKVVRGICSLVPCPVQYDMSFIQGHERLAQEIASMFDHVKASRGEESTCMVGLHGVGGVGKSTLCRTMVNYYNTSQYPGRSCLIEFPSDGDHKSKLMVEECKNALKKLTDLSSEFLLDRKIHSFEEVIPVMTDHAKKHDVFLAIDNVWENSMVEARRLLSVGFSANSRILLTSRSERVLKDLLAQHPNIKCRTDPLPTPEHEEAFQIFQKNFDPCNGNALLNTRDQIDILLKRCNFGGKYHPLALQALACHTLKSVRTLKELENRTLRDCLSVILKDISNADLGTVKDVIRLNYDNLRRQIKKHVFLDIANIFKPRVDPEHSMNGTSFNTVIFWLCMLYKELPETKITMLIGDLASDGLIQINIDAGKDGTEKRVKVHDLYLDLAHEEAAKSSRFLVRGSPSLGEEIEWERLERVVLRSEETCFFEKVRNKKCGKVHMVYADKVTIRSKMRLNFLPSLRGLFLRRVDLVCEKQSNFRNMMERAAAPSSVIKLDGLVQLQILHLESCGFVETIKGLDALPNLRILIVEGCPSLKMLEGLSCLTRLEQLHVEKCDSLLTINGVKRAERQLLWLWNIVEAAMVKEKGRFLSSWLRSVRVVGCGKLDGIPDVGGLTCLQRLELEDNRALQVEVGGECMSSTLKTLTILNNESVGRFPRLDECVQLEELRGASQGIIKDSLLLGKLPKLRKLFLKGSDWSSSDRFNEQWKQAILLQELIILNCHLIEKLELGCLMNSLSYLIVGGCGALEEIGDLSALHCLEILSIQYCPKLRKVGGLEGISGHLEGLAVVECESMEESSLTDVTLLSSLEVVVITNCGNIKDWRKPTTHPETSSRT